MKTLAEIVEDYILRYQKEAEKELKWFKIQKSLEDTICKAALTQKPSGKRFDHQRRLQKSALEKARQILLKNVDKIRRAKNSDELYEITEELLLKAKGIGEFYIYDTVLRIGTKLGLEPDKIYLHKRTCEGAKRLGLNIKKNQLEVDD